MEEGRAAKAPRSEESREWEWVRGGKGHVPEPRVPPATSPQGAVRGGPHPGGKGTAMPKGLRGRRWEKCLTPLEVQDDLLNRLSAAAFYPSHQGRASQGSRRRAGV